VRLGVWQAIDEALVGEVRVAAERAEQPRLGIIDSQSVRLGEKGGTKLGLTVSKKSKGESGLWLLMF
jgi:hypothetical protein